jgi:hypothetical protein
MMGEGERRGERGEGREERGERRWERGEGVVHVLTAVPVRHVGDGQ